MTIRYLFAIIFFLFSTTIVDARAIEQTFSIEADSDFSDARATLQTLLTDSDQTRQNHFCVIGQIIESGERQAWVYWREGREIILWERSITRPIDLKLSRRSISLEQDVVPVSDERLATSTYLVSQEWVADFITECNKLGTQITLD